MRPQTAKPSWADAGGGGGGAESISDMVSYPMTSSAIPVGVSLIPTKSCGHALTTT